MVRTFRWRMPPPPTAGVAKIKKPSWDQGAEVGAELQGRMELHSGGDRLCKCVLRQERQRLGLRTRPQLRHGG
jgi:hypothetical protein